MEVVRTKASKIFPASKVVVDPKKKMMK